MVQQKSMSAKKTKSLSQKKLEGEDLLELLMDILASREDLDEFCLTGLDIPVGNLADVFRAADEIASKAKQVQKGKKSKG